MSSSRETLERDDLQQLLDYDSWNDLQDQIAEAHGDELAHREFATLAPGLVELKTFTDLRIPNVGPRIESSAIWGFARLIVKVCNALPIPFSCADTNSASSSEKRKPPFSPLPECCTTSAIRSGSSTAILPKHKRLHLSSRNPAWSVVSPYYASSPILSGSCARTCPYRHTRPQVSDANAPPLNPRLSYF